MTSTVPASIHDPLPTAQTEPLDLIFIEGFTGHTVIGIHDSELHRPQPVVIDLCVGVPRPRACDTDDIGHTIDYGDMRTRLQRLLAEHRVHLLEAFAEQVANMALYEFHAHWVRVRVVKPKKFEDTAAVGVTIERRRPVSMDAHRAATTLRLIGAGHVPGGR
jgi:7,8-dihydroneopterin aldolase/epimerase/oxygenase